MVSNKPDNGQKLEHSGLLAEERETEAYDRFIRLLNHYRHDWMNEIQVLFGYVKLKKYDKLEDLMEKIRHKVQREGYIAKLGIPELTVYLLAYQAEVKEIALDVAIEREIRFNELPLDAGRVVEIVTGIMETCKLNARRFPDGEHKLGVSFVHEADRVMLAFDYEGELERTLRSSMLERMNQEKAESWECVEAANERTIIRIALLLNT